MIISKGYYKQLCAKKQMSVLEAIECILAYVYYTKGVYIDLDVLDVSAPIQIEHFEKMITYASAYFKQCPEVGSGTIWEFIF